MSIQQTPFGQKRIAKPLREAKSHYTVLVVGSGYGAGVAASRLARAGQDVCVLERGKEMLPGEYPNKIGDAQDAVQFNVKGGRIGAPAAMFEVHVNADQYALVGCGLGGTSPTERAEQRRQQCDCWQVDLNRLSPDAADGRRFGRRGR